MDACKRISAALSDAEGALDDADDLRVVRSIDADDPRIIAKLLKALNKAQKHAGRLVASAALRVLPDLEPLPKRKTRKR